MISAKPFKKIPLILVFIVIYISNDTFTFGTNDGKVFEYIKISLYSLVIFYLLTDIFVNSKKTITNPALVLCLFAASIILTSLYNLDFTNGYIYQFIIILMAFLISNKLNLLIFFSRYSEILFFLSISSLIIYFIPIEFFSLFPVQENYAGLQFINTYVGAKVVGQEISRNSGVFREAGVFVVYLIIGIMFELFIKNKPNRFYILIFIISLLTTASTSGYIALLVIIIIRALQNAGNLKRDVLFIIPATLMIIFIGYNDVSFFNSIFSKLSSTNESYGSTLARIASLTVNLEIFSNDPFLGIGFDKYPALFESISTQQYGIPLKSDGMSTNSYMSLLAYYGITPFLLALFGNLIFCLNLNIKIYLRFFAFLLISYIFSTQDMRYSIMFFILIFFGYKKIEVEKK